MSHFFAQITRIFIGFCRFFFRISNDLLVLLGVIIILWANFQVNRLFGWYSVGIALVLFGFVWTRIVRRKPQK